MDTDNCAPENAAQHRQLAGWVSDVPAVLSVDCVGQPPQLTTELVVRGDRVPPGVCVAIGRCGLAIQSVDRQGTAVVATVR